MKFLNKMERKFGRYAIRNLTWYIIVTYIIGFSLELLAPQILGYITLEPALIMRGQIWRLVSWVLVPPTDLGFFTIVMLFLYFSLGSELEHAWGAFRYNLYIFMGVFTSVIGAFILYFSGINILGYTFSTFYLNMSIFLAYAATYPNERLYVYFLIPIKIKWLGIIDAVFLLYAMVKGGWATRVVVLASLANFVLFFLMTRNMRRVSPREIRRKQNFQRQVRSNVPSAGVTKHKCAICGRTELDGEHLEFRFCSKCDGNYEYCQDHLFTHEHVHK